MSMEVLGGSDGPASIFLVGNLGLSWINIVGVIIILSKSLQEYPSLYRLGMNCAESFPDKNFENNRCN